MIKEITVTYVPDEHEDEENMLETINAHVDIKKYRSTIESIQAEARRLCKYTEMPSDVDHIIEKFRDFVLEEISTLPKYE